MSSRDTRKALPEPDRDTANTSPVSDRFQSVASNENRGYIRIFDAEGDGKNEWVEGFTVNPEVFR